MRTEVKVRLDFRRLQKTVCTRESPIRPKKSLSLLWIFCYHPHSRLVRLPFSTEMFTAFAFVVVILRWHSAVAIDVATITRDTYDLIQFSNCSKNKRESLNCHEVYAIRTEDRRTCTCKCKPGYITYRDPYVKFGNGQYQYSKDGQRGCVWYAGYHEGKKLDFFNIQRRVSS